MTKSEMVAIAKARKTSGASDETKVEVAISMLNTGSFAENAKYTVGQFFWDSECWNHGNYEHVWLRKPERITRIKDSPSVEPSFED